MAVRRDISIPASDGYPLAASLFEPDRGISHEATVVIGSATAVPRRFYEHFATYLAESAAARVLTFDYRGIGGSRAASGNGVLARMRDWGERDIAGVLTWAAEGSAQPCVRWIGHSYGGFGPVLAPNHAAVERLLAVATMSGYWGHMHGSARWKVALVMGALVPGLAHIFGHATGRLLGGAEDLPKGIALEFSRWCMSPDFLFADETLASRDNFASFAAPVRFVRPLDDLWCTEAGLAALHDKFSAAADLSIWRANPAEAGGPIGHVGFFRERFRHTLWAEARDWIMAPQVTGHQIPSGMGGRRERPAQRA